MARVVLPDLNLANAERILVTEALAQAGSIVEAAQLLGVTRNAVKRAILRHRIDWPRAAPRIAEAS